MIQTKPLLQAVQQQAVLGSTVLQLPLAAAAVAPACTSICTRLQHEATLVSCML